MHCEAVAFVPLIIRLGPEASSDRLRRSARCEKCGAKGAALQQARGRHGPWVGTVSRVIVAKRLGQLSTEEPPKALCRRRQSESCQIMT